MEMGRNDIIDSLKSLVQLDYDASKAYEEAIEKIDARDIREQLTDYKEDHDRHVSVLLDVIRTLGSEPPKLSQDLKGYLMEGYTSLRSSTGTKGALEAMHTNEKTTNKSYADALMKDFPDAVMTIIRNNYADEQRHLAYIESALGFMAATK